MEDVRPGHYVAIFGGAVAGSEAAEQLSQRGIRCAVFEQNALPYGKIETGLPKWHIKLRDSQEKKIDNKLNHALIDFVPNLKLGKDIYFEDIVSNWGFSAVLLATGAWRDRPLPITGIEKFLNKGLYYQNPFVAWFNHKHDTSYKGPRFQIYDDTIIIGGGLASFDVVKIIMIELVQNALEKRGIQSDVLTIEKIGIPKALESTNLSFSDLGIKGCTLYYRRTVTDMPLTALPANPTQHDIETAHKVRQRIFDNMQSKYLFRFQACHSPINLLEDNDRLNGMIFRKAKIENGRVQYIRASDYKVKTPLVISAIGSLPEPIKGIPMREDIYDVIDPDTGQLNGFRNVFVLGNAVTGRGNIKESQVHGRRVSERVMDEFLAWREEDYKEIFKRAEQNADRKIEQIGDYLESRKVLSAKKMNALHERIKRCQNKTGYNGDYDNWVKSHLPQRLENIINYQN